MFLYMLSLYFYVMIILAIGIICKPSLLPFSSMNNIFCYQTQQQKIINNQNSSRTNPVTRNPKIKVQ
jgi:hypothetical protein